VATRRPSSSSQTRRKAPPPRRGRTLVAVIIGALLGAGGLAVVTLTGITDSDADAPTTTAVAPSSTVTPSTAPEPTVPASTQAPTTTAVPESTTTTQPPLRTIEVIVGTDDGPERIDTVALGSPVELSITNPEGDDEFHLHGYDLGGGVKVPAGETLVLKFVADRAGLFEVESHRTHDVLVVLLVE
jgi:hypothetical protein